MRAFELRNGDKLPALGLGTWKSAPGEVGAAVKEAILLGYRHVDCAAIYANEAEVGETLATCLTAGVTQREQLWITSKLWNDSHAPADVIPALKRTLSDLRLDYLDLYLIHWPVATRKGVLVPRQPDELISLDELPIAATWAALERAVELGLVRHIGVSNFSATKLERLCATARTRPAVNQVELHPYLQQHALVERCRELGVIVTAYSPLGSRDRPPAMRKDDEPLLLGDPVIAEIARRHAATPAQVLLAWALARDTAVLAKSVNRERIAENFEATKLQLTPEDIKAIAALDRQRRYVTGEFFTLPGGPYTLASLWDEG